jgi:hypothetical protein
MEIAAKQTVEIDHAFPRCALGAWQRGAMMAPLDAAGS